MIHQREEPSQSRKRPSESQERPSQYSKHSDYAMPHLSERAGSEGHSSSALPAYPQPVSWVREKEMVI